MFSVQLKETALKDLKKIDKLNKKRILKKIEFFVAQENHLRFAVKLTDSDIGEYRWRIGVYRVIFDVNENIIIILRIRHRRGVYTK